MSDQNAVGRMQLAEGGVLTLGALASLAVGFPAEAGTLALTPERLRLSSYQLDVLPGLLSGYLDIGIEKALPRYVVGQVASFDVKPFRKADPVVVVCAAMDLRMYYAAWKLMALCDGWRVSECLPTYDRAVRLAIRSARGLGRDEIQFFICEALHFRNIQLGRGQ